MAKQPTKPIRDKLDTQDKELSRLARRAANRLADWLEEQARGLLEEGNARGKADSRSLRQQLEERGLNAVLSSSESAYEQVIIMIEEIMGDITGRDFSYANINRRQLKTLIDYSQLGIVKQLSANIEGLRNSIATTVVLGNQPNYDDLQERLVRISKGQLQTEYETELAGFHRASNELAAKQAKIDRFIYYGGLIRDSRPFCVARAGKIYTREQLEKMDNGQGLPVLPYLGGYNCRHLLVPVPEGREEEVIEDDGN